MKKRAWLSWILTGLALAFCGCDGSAEPGAGSQVEPEDRVAETIKELDRICREQTVYMVGPEKGARLAESRAQLFADANHEKERYRADSRYLQDEVTTV